MSYGILVAKPGFNAEDPTIDRKNFTFDSRLEHFQFKREDKATVTFASDTTMQIPHGRSYPSAFLAFMKKSGNTYWQTTFTNIGTNDAYVGDTNLSLEGETGDQMTYFLFTKPIDPSAVAPAVTTGGYGILSVIPGADANNPTETDINFTSGWGSLIIYQEMNFQLNISAGGDTQSSSQAHGMGYPPAFLATVNDGLNLYTEPLLYADFTDSLSAEIRVDETNVTAFASTTSGFGAITFDLRVHLFTEELGV